MIVGDVRISLSGRLRIDVGGRSADVAALGVRGQVAFAFLAVERHRSVSRDELAEVVWSGRPPRTWPDALRGVVSRLRAVLDGADLCGDQTVVSAGGCYQLCLPPGSVIDIEQAAEGLQAARAALAGGRVAPASEAARLAVSLSAGHFLAGATGLWVDKRQSALTELRLQALEVLSEAALANGDTAAAIEAAAEVIAAEPFRESAHVRLIYAHASAGNRAEALRAYERCRQTLADELGVNPSPATEAAYLDVVADATRVVPPADGEARGLLPSWVTSFVGRREAIEDITGCIRSHRVVTLMGMGGIGKSRLAMQVAGALSGEYDDGARLVELTSLADPALLAAEVLAVLGGQVIEPESATEAIFRHVGLDRSLLVLDNCEHLVTTCGPLVETLIRRCPNLRVLATTRQPLGVSGEVTWQVPPLETPGPGGRMSSPELLRCESVRLFVDRAATVAPDLRFDDAVLAAVTLIGRRLEGIPLAIELAAGWARVLSVADIAERLDDLSLLVDRTSTAPARHRTLRSVLDWSYESLSADDAETLRGLSVFAGGFTLAAALAVRPGTEADVLVAISNLVDRSLVLVDRSGPSSRYHQLETVRQYAAARLVDSGDEQAWRRRHLAWAVELAECAESRLQGADQLRWLKVLDADRDNLRAGLDWASGAEADAELGGRLAAALWRFWEIRGSLAEGRGWLSGWAARPDLSHALRAKILNSAAVLAERQRDYAAARAYYEECLALRRSSDERLGVASAMHGLANIAFLEGDLDEARSRFRENLALARELDAPALMAGSLQNLGVIEECLIMRGVASAEDAGFTARSLFLESLAQWERLGDRQGMALSLENLGTLSGWLHEYEDAREHQEASLAIKRQLGDKPGIAVSLRALTRLALRAGDADAARMSSEEYLDIEREIGRPSAEAEALAVVAEVAVSEDRLRDARRLLEQSVELTRRHGQVPGWILTGLADVARSQRDFAQARAALEELLSDARSARRTAAAGAALGRLSLVALAEHDMARVGAYVSEALEGDEARQDASTLARLAQAMAGVALDAGDGRLAAELLGASSARRSDLDPQVDAPFLGAEYDDSPAALRDSLGDDVFAETWEAGVALDGARLAAKLDDAVRRLNLVLD